MKQCSSYWSGYVEECKSPLFLVQHGPYFHSLLNVCRPAKLVVVAAAIPKFPLFSTYSSFSFLSLVSLFPFATSFSSFWHCSSTTNTIGALPRTSKSERTTSYNTQEGYPTTKRAKRDINTTLFLIPATHHAGYRDISRLHWVNPRCPSHFRRLSTWTSSQDLPTSSRKGAKDDTIWICVCVWWTRVR